jgi:hypothetical protein
MDRFQDGNARLTVEGAHEAPSRTDVRGDEEKVVDEAQQNRVLGGMPNLGGRPALRTIIIRAVRRRTARRLAGRASGRQPASTMSRGGCQHRWTFLVNGEHGDSMTSRRDSPSRRASGRHLRESLPGRFQPQIRDTNRRDIGKSQPIWPIPRWKRQYIMRRTESTMPVPVG